MYVDWFDLEIKNSWSKGGNIVDQLFDVMEFR